MLHIYIHIYIYIRDMYDDALKSSKFYVYH